MGNALDNARWGKWHLRYWWLGGLGIMLDGYDFFIIGAANPLVEDEFSASAWQLGLVSTAAILGAFIGAAFLGPLGDRLGRRRIFKWDLIMFVVFSIACMFAWDVYSLIVMRFLVGIAIGLDYPIAASFLAEILPIKNRGRWLVSAFALQAVGMLLGALIGVLALTLLPSDGSWRWMLGFGAIPALLIVFLRRVIPESPRWLAQNGAEAEAIAVASQITGRDDIELTAKDRRKSGSGPSGAQIPLPASTVQTRHDPAHDLHRRAVVPDGHRRLRGGNLHTHTAGSDASRRE